MNATEAGPNARPLDWVLFFLAPVFFSSNIIFGRGITGEIAPFTTAFIRWAGSALIILPFVLADRKASSAFVTRHWGLWLWLGFLGMGICGGLVYWALTATTAANATLIYTTSSLFIILLQYAFHGRAISRRELSGMLIAFAGVAVIVLKGSLEAVFALSFNIGDLGILAAAIAFAIYSLALRNPATRMVQPLALFGLLSFSGAVVLAPLAVTEVIHGGLLPDSTGDWITLAGIILFASLAAFYCFQHAVQVFGPTLAGTTLYLMPPISILMAIAFLGESFHAYHAAGIVFVMGGLLLATLPARKAVKM